MSLPGKLRLSLEQMLTDSEIDEFESGESALFISEPDYAFFRFDSGEYQRADVVRDMDPDGDAQMRIYHDVYRTTANELEKRLKDVSDLDVVPAEVGFGDI
ncbi:hypothetical protein [Natronomonas sp. EA1]|uniref:hypothetical protein n=1 Tax=Natronomonas sp. EA1 TaxID=3421655 RepID=UPI003EB9CAA9